MGSSGTVNATVYIVRHGECAGNVAQMAMEPSIDTLTDIGRTQAALLGKCLKNVAFTRAYASDYPRTFETAQIVLRESEVVSEDLLQPERRIRERDYSGIIGMSAAGAVNVLTDSMKKGTRYLDAQIPGSETVQQFQDRIIDFFGDLIKDLRKTGSSEESILIVSHALTIQRLMILLNQRAIDFGIQAWDKNLFSEKMMKNTTFHKVVLEIPRDETAPVVARVDYAHFREHVNGDAVDVSNSKRQPIKDMDNYTFLEAGNELGSFEQETVHYCKPV